MKYITIVLLLINLKGFSQTRDIEFENFKSMFPIESFPYNTSSLNDYKKYDSISDNKNMLKNIQCVMYFFNGDKKQSSYRYESFNMETGEKTGQKLYEYTFYSTFRLETREWLMLGFMRDDMNDYRYYLAIYRQGQSKIFDLVEINRVNEELLPDLIQYSLVEENLNIKTIKYEINPKYQEEIKTKDKPFVNKTLITFRTSHLNRTTGKYEPARTEKAKSNCSVSEFRSRKIECVSTDPFRNEFSN